MFQVFNLLDNVSAPKRYTVGAHRRLHDSFPGDASGDYHLEVHGPNGFLRVFRGNLRRDASDRKAPLPEVRVDYQPTLGRLQVQLINRGRQPLKLTLGQPLLPGRKPDPHRPAGPAQGSAFLARSSGNWYDFSVRAQGVEGFLRRFSGRMEDGRAGFSDPGMGLGSLTF